MDQYYELTNRVSTSCDFLGNATIVSNAPSGTAAVAAQSSCLANPDATFVPVAPTTATGAGSSGTGSGSSGGQSGSGGSKNGASGMGRAVAGVVAMVLGVIGGGLLVLA